MNQSVLTGKNALRAQQHRIDNIANNIANINTNGYKTVRTDFQDLIYRTMIRPTQPQDDVNQERGHGIRVAMGTNILTQGSIMETENPLDFCIDGPGYFAVEGLNGQTQYTRDGSFYISVENGGNFLVNSQGMYVLDVNGNRINLGDSSQGINVSEQGVITVGADNRYVGQFGLYTFANREGLSSTGGNFFEETDASGAPIAAPQTTKIIQYAVEGSNVDLAQEMTMMVRAQRSFQIASRAITTADSMDSVANTMRG